MDLRANTAVDVLIGPFVDKTDGNTTEDSLTLTRAEIKLSKNGQALTQKTDVTSAAFDDDGYYNCELDATDTDTEGDLVLIVHQSANALPVRHEYNVLSEAAWDSLYVAKDTGFMDVNVKAISESTGAADNQETLYDGVEGFAAAYAGPRGPGVYVNDAAANTNTVNGVDGTWSNPVSTIAAAKTIADSLSVDRLYLINDTAITLVAAMEDYEFIGIGEMSVNVITLGSQDVDNSYFENLLITGTQGGTGRFQAKGCCLSTITGMEVTALACLIADGGSLTLRDDCAFDACFSAVAGGGTPTLDINSVANVDVYFRHYSGGLQVNNAVATTVMSYESDGQLVIDATCISLTVHVRGNCTITDNGTTTSLTQDAAVTRTSINAECDTAISDAALATAANLATVLTGTPVTKYMGPRGPGVYIDSGAANTNTVVGTDGTVDNPVSTFAAARTIADAIGLTRYYLEGNSDITLAATHLDWEFVGVGSVGDNIINLGSQDVSRSLFKELTIEGTQGGAGRIEAIECALQDPGAGATTLHIFALRCGLVDDIEVDTSNNNVFDSCYSLVAGATTPKIIATGASGTIEIRHYSGGIELSTLSASHNVSIEGMGQVIFTADCNVNASVSIRGLFTITDNTAGMSNLTQDAVVNMLKINAEADTAINEALDTAISELGVAAPTATPTLRTALMLLYMALRNKLIVQTSGTDALEVHNDAGTKICSGAVTDAAGDLTRAKLT